MKAAINTSPLIFFSKLHHLDLLDDIEILIPRQVYAEIEAGNSKGEGEFELLALWIIKKKIKILDVEILNPLKMLGKGEGAAISLAIKEKTNIVILDDRKGAMYASSVGLKPKGTISIIIDAKKKGKISSEDSIRTVLDLLNHGFRMREEYLFDILKVLNEK